MWRAILGTELLDKTTLQTTTVSLATTRASAPPWKPASTEMSTTPAAKWGYWASESREDSFGEPTDIQNPERKLLWMTTVPPPSGVPSSLGFFFFFRGCFFFSFLFYFRWILMKK